MSENQSAGEVNSTGSKREKSPEEKAKWAAYIRDYRKRRKLSRAALEAAEVPGSGQGIPAPESSPVEAPSES